MSDQEIERTQVYLSNVTLDVRPRRLRFEKVTGPSIMSAGKEGITNSAGELASY